MGKSTRKKQAKLEKREEQVVARLSWPRESGKGKHIRGAVTAQTKGIMTEILQLMEPYYLRPIEDWVYKGKSKKIDKQRLSLLRHLCGEYPVPNFLEAPMIVDDNDRWAMPIITALSAESHGNIIPWYAAIAQGKSLYKTCTRDILTKRETHLLLQAPTTLGIKGAIWWAKTMAIIDDIGVAYRISSSNFVTRATIKSDFWIDVHRFFTVNTVPLKDIDELLDYIMAAHQENRNWTIKKRSLEAVRRKSEEWHRAQYKMKHIGGGSWDGIDIPTWTHATGKFNSNPRKDTKTAWKIEQILTGNKLAQEGQKMRHCVASYKPACVDGRTAIFSMTSDSIMKSDYRNLTIEVNVSDRKVVQSRGYANRLATTPEQNILDKWAKENYIQSRSGW